MIHYHGLPITPDEAAVPIVTGRHCLVSYAHPRQITLAAEYAHSFVLDNGAFSFWRSGRNVDWNGYYKFVSDWYRHPGFDWALIPDVIDGDAYQNDMLIGQWPFSKYVGVPVWHLHEPLERLHNLVTNWPRVAFGSSAQFSKVGSQVWWARMEEALTVSCDKYGQPLAKLHGLRMLDPRIFTRLPLASADSSNVARNIGIDKKWIGTYAPPTKAARGIAIATKVESHLSAQTWISKL